MHPPTIQAILRSPIRSFRSLVFVANYALIFAVSALGTVLPDRRGCANFNPENRERLHNLASGNTWGFGL